MLKRFFNIFQKLVFSYSKFHRFPFFSIYYRMNAHVSLCVLTADPSLGKVDKDSLSQQTLMELLIEGITKNKENILRITEGNAPPKDIAEWNGVTLDDDGKVTQIDWDEKGLGGEVSLQWIPQTVHGVLVAYNLLTGDIDLSDLSEGIENFNAKHNCFTGKGLALAVLPKSLMYLDLSYNPISGNIQTYKHERLNSLGLGGNCFEGTIDFSDLPPNLEYLCLASNKLSGSVDLSRLPAKMTDLYLQNNRFGGEVDLTHLPRPLKYLYLNKNRFSGDIILENLPETMQRLLLNDNAFAGSVVMTRIPENMDYYIDDSKA